MAFKRPKSIQIGAFTYKVIYHRRIGKLMGQADKDKKRIDIWKHESKQVLRDTILHEILHILMEDVIDTIEKMNCESEDKEESVIRILTPRLLQLILDNPSFISWLSE